MGVFWGNFAMQFPKKNYQNTMELMQWFSQRKLKPHIHQIFPLKETSKALEEMMQRKVKGKIVIQNQ